MRCPKTSMSKLSGGKMFSDDHPLIKEMKVLDYYFFLEQNKDTKSDSEEKLLEKEINKIIGESITEFYAICFDSEKRYKSICFDLQNLHNESNKQKLLNQQSNSRNNFNQIQPKDIFDTINPSFPILSPIETDERLSGENKNEL